MPTGAAFSNSVLMLNDAQWYSSGGVRSVIRPPTAYDGPPQLSLGGTPEDAPRKANKCSHIRGSAQFGSGDPPNRASR